MTTRNLIMPRRFFCHGEIDLATSTIILRYDSKVSSQVTYGDNASGQVVSSVLKQGSWCLVHTYVPS